jgi:hypothetical protein
VVAAPAEVAHAHRSARASHRRVPVDRISIQLYAVVERRPKPHPVLNGARQE